MSDAHARPAHFARLLVVVLVLFVAGVLAGCVNREKRDVESATETLDACIAEHGRDHPECEEARLRLKDAQERYDQSARRAWSCDPTQDLCPTPR